MLSFIFQPKIKIQATPIDSQPEHKTIVVCLAKAVAVEGAKSEVGVLLLGSSVAKLAGGDRVFLRVDDLQPPGGPVIRLLIVFICSHPEAGQEYSPDHSETKWCAVTQYCNARNPSL